MNGDQKRTMETMELPQEISTLLNFLRNKLVEHGFAFGAIFARKIGVGDVLMTAENMTAEMRLQMLADLIAAAEQARKRFQT